jgi:hypothetical protein
MWPSACHTVLGPHCGELRQSQGRLSAAWDGLALCSVVTLVRHKAWVAGMSTDDGPKRLVDDLLTTHMVRSSRREATRV